MKSPKRIFYIGPENIKCGVSPNQKVALALDYDRTILGLAPDLALGIELSLADARHLAQALLRMADEIEVQLRPN